jgi:tetratricopeptide (TPR) repeat protein
MIKYVQAVAQRVERYWRWFKSFLVPLLRWSWGSIPSYLPFYLLIIVTGYAWYNGRQQTIVISAFQLPPKSEAQGFPFNGETVANVLRDAIYSIQQEAEGRSPSPQCDPASGGGGDIMHFDWVGVVPMATSYERPGPIIVEVKGFSVAGLVSLAREILGREKLISGDVVLDGGESFQLMARTSDSGPWFTESQVISLSGLKKASCALAQDVMKVTDRNVLASALIRRGKYKDVIAIYGSHGGVGDVVALNNLGVASFALDHTDDAVVRFRQAIALKPRSSEAHANLAVALAHKGCYDEAIAEDKKAIALKPESPSAQGNLGYYLSMKGLQDEAITQFKKAVELEPDVAGHHVRLGTALGLRGRRDEADVELKKALDLRPRSAEVHEGVATAFVRAARTEEAIAEYQKAIELKPDFLRARIALATVLISMKRLDDGVSECKRVLAFDPDSSEGHDCLGLALILKGPNPWFALEHNDEIVAEFKKAVDLKPDSADSHYWLGYALALYLTPDLNATGKLDEAISEFKKAIALKCDYREARDALAEAEARSVKQNTTPP